MITIQKMMSTLEIEKCFNAFLELRPHLKDSEAFVNQVIMQQKEGYELISIMKDGEIVGCIGYRQMITLAWGKILYIDDLIVRERYRSKKYGRDLLRYAISIARNLACDEIHLDTGYMRHAAHKLYLQHDFKMVSHHMALKL